MLLVKIECLIPRRPVLHCPICSKMEAFCSRLDCMRARCILVSPTLSQLGQSISSEILVHLLTPVPWHVCASSHAYPLRNVSGPDYFERCPVHCTSSVCLLVPLTPSLPSTRLHVLQRQNVAQRIHRKTIWNVFEVAHSIKLGVSCRYGIM